MPSQVSPSSTSQDRSVGRWSWLLPAGTFVAGCALGGVVVGVGAVGTDVEPAAPQAGAAAEPAPDGGQAASEGEDEDAGLYVRVPEECIQTADDASALVEQVDRVVAAVAELDPGRLRQTVDDVQQVRDDVQDVAEQCRRAAEQSLRDGGDEEPTS